MKRLILSGSSRCGTTITGNIINSHPDIWLTNELRIYNDRIHQPDYDREEMLSSKTAKDYFENIINKVKRGEGFTYHRLPPHIINLDHLFSLCMENLKEDTLIGRIEAIEKSLFSGRYELFGDKSYLDESIIRKFYENNINYKVVFMIRDGRDVAASGVRHRRGGVAPWSNNPVENIMHWAEVMSSFFNNTNLVKSQLVLRFEDYVLSPLKNFDLLSDFLEVDLRKYKDLISVKESHIGNFNKYWSNWSKECPEEAKKILSFLGYI